MDIRKAYHGVESVIHNITDCRETSWGVIKTTKKALDALKKLPPDAPVEAVEAILRSNSMTTVYCDGCGNRVREAAFFYVTLSYDDGEVAMCRDCIQEAAKGFEPPQGA